MAQTGTHGGYRYAANCFICRIMKGSWDHKEITLWDVHCWTTKICNWSYNLWCFNAIKINLRDSRIPIPQIWFEIGLCIQRPEDHWNSNLGIIGSWSCGYSDHWIMEILLSQIMALWFFTVGSWQTARSKSWDHGNSQIKFIGSWLFCDLRKMDHQIIEGPMISWSGTMIHGP